MAPEHDEEPPAPFASPDRGDAAPDAPTAQPVELDTDGAGAADPVEQQPEAEAEPEPLSQAEPEPDLEPEAEPEPERVPAVAGTQRRRPAARRRPPASAERTTARRSRPARDGPPKRTRDEPDERVRPAGPTRTKIIVLAALTVVVVILVVVAVLISGTAGKKKTAAKPAPTGTTPSTVPATGLITFRDDETAFTIQYPKDWVRKRRPQELQEIRLVAVDPEARYALEVRVTRTEQPTTPGNLPNIKTVTDGIIGSNASARILYEQTVTINGLIGYYYLYSVKDANGLEGIHAHYFLFQGHKMNRIVFEALPADDIGKVEGIFDQIIHSFHSDPEPPNSTAAPGPPTTSR